MKNTLFLFLLILLGVAGMPATPHAQTRHYVRPQAQGQNNGTTWSNAFTDLQTALDVAASGDEVWVAEGIYLPTSGMGRDKRFNLPSNVKLYGGFEGSETDLAQRDHEAHPTVLSGNIGSPTDSTDNVYTILYLNNPEAETRIDGLVFEGGYAHSDTTFVSISPTLSGGAVYVQAKNGVGLPVFAHCTFRNNSAKVNGGAVFVYGQNSTQSMPLFHFCNFEKNAAGGAGGAVNIWGGSNVDRGIEFWGCTFDGNKAVAGQSSRGGGIFYRKVSSAKETIELVSCDIHGNGASILAGFLYVQLEAYKSRVVIDSCTFENNYTENGGASVFQESAFSTKELYLTIFNSTFRNNFVNDNQGTGMTLIMPDLASAVPGQIIRDTIMLIKNYFESNDMFSTLVSS
ncbi:MAG: hypothetical protein IT270_05785 [Saprospiraceae bacterium]|nr:hypothetical protein [Saprospiraceae bacterium]